MVIYELQKLWSNRLLMFILIAVLSIWGFMLYHTEPHSVLMKSLTFWNKLGSLSFALIILMINTKIFSIDLEEQVEDVLNTAKHGKRQLFLTRLLATTLFTALIYLIFLGIQIGITIAFLQVEQVISLSNSMSFIMYFMLQMATVFIGAIIFTVFTAVICSILKSHVKTLIICGLLFGITYITRTSLVSKYSLYWLLDKGFFSILIRGELFNGVPVDFMELISLATWYSALLTAVLVVNKKLQRRRKEL